MGENRLTTLQTATSTLVSQIDTRQIPQVPMRRTEAVTNYSQADSLSDREKSVLNEAVLLIMARYETETGNPLTYERKATICDELVADNYDIRNLDIVSDYILKGPPAIFGSFSAASFYPTPKQLEEFGANIARVLANIRIGAYEHGKRDGYAAGYNSGIDEMRKDTEYMRLLEATSSAREVERMRAELDGREQEMNVRALKAKEWEPAVRKRERIVERKMQVFKIEDKDGE